MSNKPESKETRRRSLATRILAWILSFLMMGSVVTLVITMILEKI